MSEKKIITRQEQRVEDTWKMEDIFATEEQFQDEVKQLEEMTKEFASYEGTLSESAVHAAKVLDLYSRMSHTFERLYVYSAQKSHEDMADAKYQKLEGEMQILGVQLGQVSAWLDPEILALPEELLQQYLADEHMKPYVRFIEQITRRKEHILDGKTEALMTRISELGQAPSNIFAMFNNADIRFPQIKDGEGNEHELTIGRYISYMESSDRELRKNAFETLYSVYRQFSNTLGAIYYANLKQADFFAKERNYKNAMEKALDASAIPVSVYENLVQTLHEALPVMYKYVRARKELLGVDELHMYDNYVALVEKPEKTYSFEEAKEIVLEGMAPLGEDYQNLLKEAFADRWIDVYENQGKRTGAYSWGAYGTHPYVLLNYHGTLDNVFTLAHEMGHALHSWHSDHAQSYLNAGYKIFVAEVASTCNEALLIHDLMNKTDDPTEKRYLINHFLDQFKGTMFRQTMFAEFEMITHGIVEKGGMLTADQLCEIYLNLNKKYFGEDMICDQEIAYEWERIPHFYTPFYVYQYATGFAAAIAISSKILAGEEGIVEKYKKFLSGGCSMDPIDLLKICDVDMSSPEPVKEALKVFEEYVELFCQA